MYEWIVSVFGWLLPVASRSPKTTAMALVALLTVLTKPLGIELPQGLEDQILNACTVIGLWCAADGKTNEAPSNSNSSGATGSGLFNTLAFVSLASICLLR